MLMYDTTLTDLEYDQPRECPHLHPVIETWGGWHYDYNEVWDDITERLICADCGADIELPEPVGAGEFEELPI